MCTSELTISTASINILALALPIFTLQVYDRILPSKSIDTLLVMLAGVVVAVLSETALRLARAKILAQSGARFEREMTRGAVRHIVNARTGATGTTAAASKLQKIQAVRVLREFHCGYALTVAIDFMFIFLYFGVVYHMGGAVVLAPLVLFALILTFSVHGGLRLRSLLVRRREYDDKRYSFLTVTLSNLAGIKAFSLGKYFERQYEPLEYETSSANLDVAKASSDMMNANAVFGAVMTVSVIGLGAMLAAQNAISIGALIACVLMSARMLPPLQRSAVLWIKYQEYDLSRSQFQALFSAPLVEANRPDVDAHPKAVLELKNVTLGQRKNTAALFKDGAAMFDGGEIVSVDADNPLQASLFLRMLSGAVAPKAGEVVLNGMSIHHMSFARRANAVAYMSPLSHLFNGSIIENLTSFGLRDADKAMEVARWFGIESDVVHLPNGWNTQIRGRPTDEASAGLRQRILLARTVVANPPLILFDEAEQFLGNRSYDLVVSAIARLRRNSVIFVNTSDENLRRFCTRKIELRSAEMRCRTSFVQTAATSRGTKALIPV